MDDWQSIDLAPRDGTLVEIRNTYGVMPTYSLCKWTHKKYGTEFGWVDANDSSRGFIDNEADWLMWRPYEGNPEDYVDPTNGAQNTVEYWQRGMK